MINSSCHSLEIPWGWTERRAAAQNHACSWGALDKWRQLESAFDTLRNTHNECQVVFTNHYQSRQFQFRVSHNIFIFFVTQPHTMRRHQETNESEKNDFVSELFKRTVFWWISLVESLFKSKQGKDDERIILDSSHKNLSWEQPQCMFVVIGRKSKATYKKHNSSQSTPV